MQKQFFFILLLGVLGLISCNCDDEIKYSNSVDLFEQPNQQVLQRTYWVASELAENQPRSTKPDGSNDNASSVSYSLAPGIVVYLCEHEDGSGKRHLLAGVGSLNLADVGMDNIISAVLMKVE